MDQAASKHAIKLLHARDKTHIGWKLQLVKGCRVVFLGARHGQPGKG